MHRARSQGKRTRYARNACVITERVLYTGVFFRGVPPRKEGGSRIGLPPARFLTGPPGFLDSGPVPGSY